MLKLRIPLPIFRNAKEIVNGENARMALKGINANKVVLIISSSFKSSKFYDQTIRLINSDSVTVVEKSWQGEPTIGDLKPVISELEIIKPDYIIALGGGSVIDGAKLAWMFYECPTLRDEDIFKPFSIPPLRGKSLFASIPTTIGSGSEVSSAAVMIDELTKSKKAIVTHDFLSDLVILDPELVKEVPKEVLKSTIADALSHATEGYVSNVNNPIMDILAEKSISTIGQNINNFLVDDPSLTTIVSLQNASMLAGIVQNHCVIGMSHAIAHQLSTYNIGHGLANGLLMPSVIKFNMKCSETNKKYDELISKSGLKNINDLINMFDTLVNLEKPKVVFEKKDIKNICKNALLDPGARTNPVIFTETNVKEILEEVF